MEQAYGLDYLTRLNRHILCLPDKAQLTDSFELSEQPTSLTERFISLIEPVITDEGVMIGESLLTYDREKVFEPEISYEDFDLINGVRRVYLIDFVIKHPEQSVSVTFEFK